MLYEVITYTAGGEVVKRFTQKMDMPNSKTFLGTGKKTYIRVYLSTCLPAYVFTTSPVALAG